MLIVVAVCLFCGRSHQKQIVRIYRHYNINDYISEQQQHSVAELRAEEVEEEEEEAAADIQASQPAKGESVSIRFNIIKTTTATTLDTSNSHNNNNKSNCSSSRIIIRRRW